MPCSATLTTIPVQDSVISVTRVLSVGHRLPFATKNTDWDERRNIKDYNVVFLDIDGFYQRDFEAPPAFVSPHFDDVMQHVQSGNDIVATLPEKTVKQVRGRGYKLLRWLPDNFDIIEESGESVDPGSINDEWRWYFDGSEFRWHLVFPIQESLVRSESSVVFGTQPIVQNVYNRAVAVELNFGRLEEPQNAVHHSVNNTTIRPWSGSIYLIPLIQSPVYPEIAKKILRYNILGKGNYPEQEDTPGWVSNYSAPRESEITDQIVNLQTEIERLEEKLSRKESELEDARRNKILLYGNEDSLEELVPSIFREMGFSVEGEEPHGEDGQINLEDRTIVLEITGTTRGISTGKCSQLSRHVQDCEVENPKQRYDGLLVINPLRKTDPKERSGYLSGDVETLMDRWGHKILTTHKLFDLYVDFRNDNVNRTEIEQLLTGDKTVLDT